ncbi:MAG: alpha-glucosidase C-terminal domain-containing protein, partial [Cellulomonas sp.]|nr:alpha-glucosidase C-terminal domain-containing protein [Cellulomonas sp.]
LFARSQPDLNWENPQVSAAVHAMMNRWLDRGVDGFRMDVINLISKDQSFPDGPVRWDGLGDGAQAYVAGPRIHEFLTEMHDAVFAHRPGTYLTVGEMPGVTVEQARLFTDPARREVDMVFDFEHVGLDHGPGGKFDVRPLRLTDLKATLGRWQTGLADVGWTSLYWDNHDQPRIVSRWGDGTPASAKALATVLHLHRGTPYVYQGEEIGMTNAGFTSLDDYADLESLRYASAALGQGWVEEDEVLAGLAAMSRDNARTPMQWDASQHAGFTTGVPSRPVNPNHVTINVAAQRDDPHSVLAHYRRLVALRRDDATVALGRFAMLLPDDEHVYAFTRTWADDRLVVVANLTAQPRAADLGEDLTGATVVLTTHQDVRLDGPPLRLRPWEALVLRPAPVSDPAEP